MGQELKPCPFCGNQGGGRVEDALHVSMCEHGWREPSWSVQCDKCTGTMGYSDTEAEAIAAWNTRATPTADDALTELIAAVEALPVEDWVEQDQRGDPYLLGYVMQAQGEWDRVRQALRALKGTGHV